MLSLHDIRGGSSENKGRSKELQRLNRHDLLELLVGQMHEADELRANIEDKEQTIVELSSLSERLKDKLDLKDEQIENLKQKLDLKDEQMDRLKSKLNLKDDKNEHLKKRLDAKDALIEKLKGRLDRKDELIANLCEAGGIGSEVLAIFEAREHVAEAASSGDSKE